MVRRAGAAPRRLHAQRAQLSPMARRLSGRRGSGLELVLHPDERLRAACEPLPNRPSSAGLRRVRRLADDMARLMLRESGVGLAAPQVGHNIQLIVLSLKAWEGHSDSAEVAEVCGLVGGRAVALCNPTVRRPELSDFFEPADVRRIEAARQPGGGGAQSPPCSVDIRESML